MQRTDSSNPAPSTAGKRSPWSTGTALALVCGFLAACSAVPSEQDAPYESHTQSSSASQTPTEESLTNEACDVEMERKTQGDAEYVCTLKDDGTLVWLPKVASEKVTEARKQAEERAQRQADKAAAEEAQRQAEEAAAEEAQRQAEEAQRQAEEAQRQAEEAAAQEAQRLAEEQAAAEAAQREAEEAAAEAQRLAEEQARKPAPADSFENCDAVRAAGADPIHRGEPGWHEELDADGDGVGCE